MAINTEIKQLKLDPQQLKLDPQQLDPQQRTLNDFNDYSMSTDLTKDVLAKMDLKGVAASEVKTLVTRIIKKDHDGRLPDKQKIQLIKDVAETLAVSKKENAKKTIGDYTFSPSVVAEVASKYGVEKEELVVHALALLRHGKLENIHYNHVRRSLLKQAANSLQDNRQAPDMTTSIKKVISFVRGDVFDQSTKADGGWIDSRDLDTTINLQNVFNMATQTGGGGVKNALQQIEGWVGNKTAKEDAKGLFKGVEDWTLAGLDKHFAEIEEKATQVADKAMAENALYVAPRMETVEQTLGLESPEDVAVVQDQANDLHNIIDNAQALKTAASKIRQALLDLKNSDGEQVAKALEGLVKGRGSSIIDFLRMPLNFAKALINSNDIVATLRDRVKNAGHQIGQRFEQLARAWRERANGDTVNEKELSESKSEIDPASIESKSESQEKHGLAWINDSLRANAKDVWQRLFNNSDVKDVKSPLDNNLAQEMRERGAVS